MYIKKVSGQRRAIDATSIFLPLCVLVGIALFGYMQYQERSKELARIAKFQQSERNWLTKLVYFEARGEGLDGQLKVARVALVRTLDSRWPNTVEAVTRQGERRLNRCQFSFMCDGQPERIDDKNAWALSQFAASVAYEEYLRKDEKALGCAHSYHADYATNTSYFRSLRKVRKVGQHIFYCDKKAQHITVAHN